MGRSHLDYLAMFKKFTFEGRASYALANICEEELGLSKLEYHGSLRDLYYNNFEQFITYNVIDVFLLVKLDKKFSFVALVNQMAHENTVPFDAILGTTRYVDTGTTNYAHNHLNVIVKDKDVHGSHEKVEGAIVLTPNRGLHEWVGSVDINSLYPSVLRSLNISPETLIGQFETPETFERMQTLEDVQQLIKDSNKAGVNLDTFFSAMSKEYDWRGIFAKDDYPHTALINGQYITKTGKQWNEYLRKQKWAVSAYGTIFDQSGKQGIIPGVLQYWYSERKALQKELKSWKKKLEELKKQNVLHSD
jgi:DNA polymerase elongation subunit (family B)